MSGNKRTADTAGMGPPGQEPIAKKTKLDTRLARFDARLTKLKQVLRPDGLILEWKIYDPGLFMDEMRRIGRRINAMTLETAGEYINDGRWKHDLTALNLQEIKLKRPLDSLGLVPELLALAPASRDRMTEYVARVRTHLNALADQVKPSPSEFADSTALYLNMANKLCEVMPSAFDSERHRRVAFEEIFRLPDVGLTQHIEFSLSARVSTATESGAVAKSIPFEGGHLLHLLEQFEVEPLGDVYMQICRAYEVLCGETKNEHLLKFGNPVFLLCVLGPYLMICGAIKRENVHVEPLTPFLPMFPEFGIEGRSVQIAHCLRALKQGLDTLKEFWQEVGIVEAANKKATTDGLPEPYLVPDCPDNGLLHFDDWQGAFESPMPGGNNPDKPPRFLAKIHNTNECRQVVVKFVYNYIGTYGTAVHEYLHGLGSAPFLYSAKTLHRGLVMVVMEHLTFEEGAGGWVELDAFEGKLGINETAVRKKLEKIINCLQSKDMVHADLRPKNIMVQVDQNHNIIMAEDEPILSVIDFDWAGLVDKACYPPLLNKKVPWPTGAKAYQKVGKDDDGILLNNWWDAFVKGI